MSGYTTDVEMENVSAHNMKNSKDGLNSSFRYIHDIPLLYLIIYVPIGGAALRV